jgi:hypothetical protein
MINWRHVGASFAREAQRARRRIALAYVVPAFAPLVAVTLFSDMMRPAERLPGFPTTTFQDYMVPGAVLLSGMMMAGFTAVGVAEDRRNGFTDRLHLLGMSRASVTLGRLLFEAVRVLPAAIGAYTLALFLGFDFGFDPLDAVALLVYGALWAMAYNAPFHLVAHRSANPHAPIAMQPLFAVVTFPSTFWFPGKLMPRWGETMTGANPVSWLTDGARVFTTPGTDVAAVALGLAVIAGTAALFLGSLHFSEAES